jgi:hypothetical protein
VVGALYLCSAAVILLPNVELVKGRCSSCYLYAVILQYYLLDANHSGHERKILSVPGNMKQLGIPVLLSTAIRKLLTLHLKLLWN